MIKMDEAENSYTGRNFPIEVQFAWGGKYLVSYRRETLCTDDNIDDLIEMLKEIKATGKPLSQKIDELESKGDLSFD